MMPTFLDRDYAAFLFDMDGTMLDSSVVVEKVWRDWAARHNVDPEELLAVCHGVRGEDLVKQFAPHADLAEEVRWLERTEEADTDGIVAIEGIESFIAGIDPSAWAIVTSAPRALAGIRLRAAGIPCPQVLVAAEDVREGKPAPEGFLLAASKLGVEIGACLIFEDSPAGVTAARAAGAAVAIVGDRVPVESGDHSLTNYR